jgi:hypothetical protein
MRALILGAAAVAALPAIICAQQPRRQQPIEIRGTVPTPQVVTVRPREVPNYDRRILVPRFYDHDFWQSILPGYLVVRQRMITGAVPGDSLAVRRDTAGTTLPAAGVTPPATAPATPPPAVPPPTAESVESASSTTTPGEVASPDGTRRAISAMGSRPTPGRDERR